MRRLITLATIAAAVSLLGTATTPGQAATDCTFTTVGSTDTLDADCTTDETIIVPDGVTLNGNGHSITAVDPSGGHFVGPIVTNGGSTAFVTHLVVQASSLINTCDSGADRLRGIMFDGASGAIWQNTIQAINQGASGCQEGNAIEVRNAPFDGTHPNTQSVEIAHNVIEDYQKTGIVCNGDVVCDIHHNFLGESATQANLAANTVQLGFGGSGTVMFNHISGNQWFGTSDYAASAVLLYLSEPSTVQRNNIGGNSDVGVFVIADDTVIDNNRIFDGGPDHANSGYDIGLGNYGLDNAITNNKLRGWDAPTDGVDEDQKVIPSPADPEVCFGTDCSN